MSLHPLVLGDALPVRLASGKVVDYANLDYAATAPCAVAAADAVTELLPWYASVHRGAGAASRRCTLAYEQARQTVAGFLGARPGDHVVFTRNTTDALNLLARALPPATTVVCWAGEHHANLLPWRRVVRLPVPASPGDAIDDLDTTLARIGRGEPVLVAVTGASNVTGEVWPVAELVELAHRRGARVALDAAQLAPHRQVSLIQSNVDYLALSGHKLYAPFGAGVLAGRADWLDAAPPCLAGGGAAAHVGDDDVTWHTGPARHEAGTPNLLGAVALAAACTALANTGWETLRRHEAALVARLRDGLRSLPDVSELRCFDAGHDRVGIVAFAVAGVPAASVSGYLASSHGIGVRDGLFCAHPLTRHLLAQAAERLGRPVGQAAVRASIGLGTTDEHVDRLLAGLRGLTRAGADRPAGRPDSGNPKVGCPAGGYGPR
jgi:selenocysteine lyase/cysteine desulfurase